MDIQTLLEFGKTEQEHFHSEIELVYVLSGSISLYLTEQEYILEKNDVLLINSSKIHSWTQEGESLLCRVYFSYSYLKQMLQRNTVSFWCNSTVGDSEAYKDLRRILNDIAADQAAKRGEDNFQLQSLEYRLLNCLSENFLSVREDVFEYEVKDERIKDTIDYLNENYMNMLSVNMLASRVYMSESAFSRLFKRETDMTYMEYLNYVRMKYAVEALSDTGKTVTEIAQECGFSYSSSFNKIFRKEYGISPTQFRERLVRVPDRNRAEDIQNASALFHEEKEQPSVNAYAPDAGNAAVIVGPEPDITENGREANTGINIGHAQDLLYTEVRSHLDQLLHNCGFKYVRLHNPFADSMYYYPEEGEDYNFAHINNVFDYLVSSNVYPFIDLSNDPKHAWLNYGENLFERDNGGVSAEQSIARWTKGLAAFIDHVTFRYGHDIVKHWKFELPYAPFQPDNDEEDMYEAYWEAAYHCIKDEYAYYQLGGDAYKFNSDIDVLTRHLAFWKKTGWIPDFITFSGDPYHGISMSKDVYARRETDYRFMKNALDRHIRLVRQYLPQIGKFCFSSWNITASDRNWFNDSIAKTAQITQILISFAGSGVDICYDYGSDYISQYFDSKSELMGARGLISKSGIPKPVSSAFYFMNKLYSQIISKGDNYILTRNENDNYYLLASNPKKFSHVYFLKPESDIELNTLDDVFDNSDDLELGFVLKGLKHSRYRIKRSVQNKDYGNLLDTWKDLGYDNNLNYNDIEYMKQTIWPHMYSEITETSDGELHFSLRLKAHETMLVHIYYVK